MKQYFTFNLLIVYFSSTVYEICFHISESFPFYFINLSISIRKCCCGPRIEPGLAILIHPMKSGALK